MAYGVNAPFGFQPRQYLNGTIWTGQPSEYLINGNVSGGGTSYATSIFTGDLVKLASDGTIQRCGVGDATIGVFNGVKWFDTNNTQQSSQYWNASTPTFNNSNPICYIIDDPDVLFDAQVAGTGALTGNVNTINIGLNANASYLSDLNYNYNISLGSGGNTTSGQSGSYIDLSTQSVNPTINGSSILAGPFLQLKLIRLTPRPGNTFGLAYNNGLVLLNNHIFKGGLGTPGI